MIYQPLKKCSFDITEFYRVVKEVFDKQLDGQEKLKYQTLNVVLRYSEELYDNPQLFGRTPYGSVDQSNLLQNNKCVIRKIGFTKAPKDVLNCAVRCGLFLLISSQQAMNESIKRAKQVRGSRYQVHLRDTQEAIKTGHYQACQKNVKQRLQQAGFDLSQIEQQSLKQKRMKRREWLAKCRAKEDPKPWQKKTKPVV